MEEAERKRVEREAREAQARVAAMKKQREKEERERKRLEEEEREREEKEKEEAREAQRALEEARRQEANELVAEQLRAAAASINAALIGPGDSEVDVEPQDPRGMDDEAAAKIKELEKKVQKLSKRGENAATARAKATARKQKQRMREKQSVAPLQPFVAHGNRQKSFIGDPAAELEKLSREDRNSM